MKNFFKFFRNLNRVRGAKVPLLIISMALVIGFTMAGCSDEPENTNQTPVAGDFDISGTGTFTFDGAAKTVTVTPKAGKTSGAVTVKYNGTAAAPSAVGTYTVTFDVAAATGWNAASGLSAGTLTINAASSFTVTFNSNGGSAVNSITGIASGTTITKPTDPTKANSTFGGWYKEAALTNAWNFATDTVNAAVTLYAKWNSAVTNFTVTFNADGGTPAPAQATVAQGGKATKPTDPTKTTPTAGLYAGALPTSFTFAEWRKPDGTAWNFTTDTVTANITLTAAYTPSPINIDGQTGANIIAKAVAYISSASGTEYTLVLGENVDNFARITLQKNDVTLTITSVDTTERVISKGTANETIFTVGAAAGTSTGVKLVIDGNVTLRGKSDNNNVVVRINGGGSLELRGNAKITGNTNPNYGGGVSALGTSGGTPKVATITMSGNAEISSNTTNYGSGGGVYLGNYSSLTISDSAKIINNTATTTASREVDITSGGVYISNNATFTMNGGEISGNSAITNNASGEAKGGGVFIDGYSNAKFIVASDAVKANIKDNTVTASAGTAGAQVYKNPSGVFTVDGTAQGTNTAQGWDSWD